MRVIQVENYEKMSKLAAKIISSQIILNPKIKIGLATGSTPVGLYEELIKLYKEKEISFSEVLTFNLDEYYPLKNSHKSSYHVFMDERLFKHVDIKISNTHIPNGEAENPFEEALRYEKAIEAVGGIDLQLLGIGVNGHIGFNEPSDYFEKETHLVDLSKATLNSNAKYFDYRDSMPTKAISVGIGTIMKSKKILLLASGASKSEIVERMIYGKVSPKVPASILQFHNDITVIVDKEAGKGLKLHDKNA